MMQEIDVRGRILNLFHLLKRRKDILSKRKTQIRPFRILAFGLGVIALVLASKFPGKAVSLERQQEQLKAAASAYYDAQSENNQLSTELGEINTPDFIERTARREYGYCWYGETIYEVGNLKEIQQEQPFEVYGEE